MVAVAVVISLATPAFAGPPSALIEELKGDVAGAELMDYVAPGQLIKLGPGGSLVLSYLTSCRRETINGAGTVTVGSGESKVESATLSIDIVHCDADHAEAGARETSEVAATIVRGIGMDSPAEQSSTAPLRSSRPRAPARWSWNGSTSPANANRSSSMDASSRGDSSTSPAIVIR
jgi:hypothetical protein